MDNDQPTAPDTLRYLAEILDSFTTYRLELAGVPEGGRCLELGAGSGSIAVWLADAVGEDGSVVATDIQPRHIPAHPRVRVLAHNLATDPLPPGRFDVINARLLLAHLPTRRRSLTSLADALAPGGFLLVEEWGAAGPAGILSATEPDAADLYSRYQATLLEVFTAHGTDTAWCRQVAGTMIDAGLVDVEVELNAQSWPGGSAGCRLPIAVFTEAWDQLVAHGADPDDLDRLHDVLCDPSTLLLGETTVSTVGRKPH
jgi:SAM-dependent methyltransferase